MRLQRLLIQGYLQIPYGFRRVTRTGPFGTSGGEYVGTSLPGGAGLQQALWANYVRQYHESSCSVASVVTAVNALRQLADRGQPPVTQQDILDRVHTGHWKERMSPSGYNGRRGLPLPLLAKVVRAALHAYRISYQEVETLTAARGRGASGPRQTLGKHLEAFAENGDRLLIAHFDQGVYVRAFNIPHISPVGAYDTATGAVTILDVDPDQPGPYRVSFDTFYKGLASNYHHVFRPFGYDGGGCVTIRLG